MSVDEYLITSLNFISTTVRSKFTGYFKLPLLYARIGLRTPILFPSYRDLYLI